MAFHLGIDVGSISINTVVMDDERSVVENHYDYCRGKPFHALKEILQQLLGQSYSFDCIAVTGTGGDLVAKLIGGGFVNEIVAQSSSVGYLYPQAKTIIEMGGEDSKLILMGPDGSEGHSRLSDFSMNSICAAGTGSFLDQQARRINVRIEKEFGELALRSDNPPRIAGRCSVFAKSDMIHLQQIATPVHDIVAGLCFAVARNFKSNLARGKDLEKPVVFQGGVASNLGMIKAFGEILHLEDDELIIPEHHASMGAIGALYHLLDHPEIARERFLGLKNLENHISIGVKDSDHLEPIEPTDFPVIKDCVSLNGNPSTDVYLGIDVGSLSTNIVLIDEDDNVIARRYLQTAGKPLDAIRIGLSEIADDIAARVNVKAVGTTGSGRYLTGDFVGADTIRNEIISQATAAIAHDPEVDTIFEIGGQDSKYISIDNGVIVDFEMNKACAAGTGSFLEEQAEKLGIDIREEFSDLAFDAPTPARLGNRCTVFMESDLNSHQQKGASKENLIGGLAYSIVQNYMQKVVGARRVGEKIFFQGGVTNNRSVVAAFEHVTGKQITVPPHFDVTGAIGVAMLARDAVDGTGKTRFKGFDISRIPFALDKFICKACSNQCEIRRIKIEGEKKALHYGGRCEKWEVEERKDKGKGIPNLFDERLEMLMGGFREEPKDDRISIGIPRGLPLFYDSFPFWREFFRDLGFRVVLSGPSDHNLVAKALEMLVAETCFPVAVMQGHVHALFESDVDFIFAPFVTNERAAKDNPTVNYNCPWVQTYPFMIKSALKDDEERGKLLIPTLHFRYFGRVLNNDLSTFMGEQFGVSKSRVVAAVKKADAAQNRFETIKLERGREVLATASEYKNVSVILGRAYNTGDPELNLHLVDKLINLDVLPVPMDLLQLDSENVFDDYPMMYWPNGRKIVAASRIIAGNDQLHGIYLSNFRCGSDSFLMHYVREEMMGKPYLLLEVDEHSADAGMVTRCEAFMDSLRGKRQITKTKRIRSVGVAASAAASAAATLTSIVKERTLYFPNTCGAVFALAAAARGCGVPSEVLPPLGEIDLELGRKYTSSKECFPMICTTGTFLKRILEPDCDPDRTTFFMPDHNGPCRFGQYRKLQRIIFDRLGYHGVQITSPSNADAYAALSGGHPVRFWVAAWQGIVATDLLTKLMRERVPYETVPGESERIHRKYLGEMEGSLENGAKDLPEVMRRAADAFMAVDVQGGNRKPIISVVGEIYMKDNPFANGFLVERLEHLGAEVVMSPFRDWLAYFSFRYARDSIWKRDLGGLLKAQVQQMVQSYTAARLYKAVEPATELEMDVDLIECMSFSEPYIHNDYDGEPIMALGTAEGLARRGISGVAHIFPFTCLPGTFVSSVAPTLRRNNGNIPWVDVAYDGQEDTGTETRLQAFMHQATDYAHAMGHDKPRVW
jgi:predicted CoA-substrate-specific enzyme activase